MKMTDTSERGPESTIVARRGVVDEDMEDEK